MIGEVALMAMVAVPVSGGGGGYVLDVVLNLLISAIVIALACLWAYQFAQLMLLRDNDFPGRFDKSLWVAAFVLLAPVTVFAFIIWKRAAIAIGAKRKAGEGRGDVLKAIGQALGTADEGDDGDGDEQKTPSEKSA